MAILYVETNFPVGIAKGQDPDGARLLAAPSASIRIAMPDICYIEALSVLKRETKQRKKFLVEQLDFQIREASRDVTSDHASSLLSHLIPAKFQFEGLLNDIKIRLYQALKDLARISEWVPLTDQLIDEALDDEIVDEASDNLILTCILHHARGHPGEVKAFLSGNSKDFGEPDVQEALRDADIHYFKDTAACLSWLTRQPENSG